MLKIVSIRSISFRLYSKCFIAGTSSSVINYPLVYNSKLQDSTFCRISEIGKNQVSQRRHFFLLSSVESFTTTQSRIFQSLSESVPVEYAQKFLVTLHNTTGLPWWATIVCSTILLRTCVTVPLSIYQYYIMAKLENLKFEMPDIVKELKKETAIAIKLFNWDEKMARVTFNRSVRKQWNNLVIRDNCHPFKASLLLWFQIPMWICLSASLRNLVYMLPVEDLAAQIIFSELSIGGFGWIPNLTEVDSSLILPIALGLINLSIIELQTLSKVNVPNKLQKYITNFFRGFSLLMIPIGASVPSCLVLYWTTSSAFGLLQNLILISPKVKRFWGIPETPSELEKPYSHIVSGIKHKIRAIPGVSKVI